MTMGLSVIAEVRDASACGGCFHQAPPPQQPQQPQQPTEESSMVSDHRMVFSLSRHQTVLWDQIRYNGDPKEFAWVLPVRPGTRVELSRDEWIASLDATTQPTIRQPQPQNVGGFQGGFDGR
ncbi:MAG: DUF2330 domain-containing protein, partial [Myxococcales bacterium]|nr:DUF2330 domain-containing protein [Myxococcales bacterium]